MLLLALACGLAPSPTDAPTAPPPVAAAAADTLDRVKVATDLAALRTAIRLYQGENEGVNPPTLRDVSVQGLHYPGYYTYDPMTGSVVCPEHPAL